MDPSQFLFDAVSQLTGGLVADLRTLCLAGIVLSFLIIGFDQLRLGFDRIQNQRAYHRTADAAKTMLLERDQYERGTVEWDEANYMYRHFTVSAAKRRIKGWDWDEEAE